MTFSPTLNLDSLIPLIERLEERRRQVFALEVAPELHQSLLGAVEARAAHLSTLIEGNAMTEAQVTTLFAEGRAAPNREEGENLDYRDAARCAAQLAGDFSADIDGGLIRALHYIVVRTTDHTETAGQYRTTQNVIASATRVMFRPPPPGEVPGLMSDLIAWLRAQRGILHPLILAAVGHVEFIKVHPFDDGNGRTGRALTRYFMLRGNWGLRGYASAEEIFGTDIPAYYANLNALGETYSLTPPDLTGWVTWFLVQFEQRIEACIDRVEGFSRQLREDLVIAEQRGALPARIGRALGKAILTGAVTSSEYARSAGISVPTAVADLNRLVDRGLLRRVGTARATQYERIAR